MSDNTKIEWARHPVTGRGATWNPITGCTLESEGCRNCYAARLAATRLRHHPSREGLARVNAEGVAKFTGEVRFNRQWIDQPLRWRTPRGVFVCAHGDLFAPGVPDEWIDQVFAVMALAPQHVFFVLTKRPARARDYIRRMSGHDVDRRCDRQGRLMSAARRSAPLYGPFTMQIVTPLLHEGADGQLLLEKRRLTAARDHARSWPLPNVWLGTSVEDQATADARIPELLATPALFRFISAEPLLGPVDLMACPSDDALLGYASDANGDRHRLDWVIVGGESGPHARPMHPDWVRNLRDQCAAAAVPFFFKQWGEWAPTETPASETQEHCELTGTGVMLGNQYLYRMGKARAGRELDGRTHDAMPEAA